jgi:predicted nucleotidyltransferase
MIKPKIFSQFKVNNMEYIQHKNLPENIYRFFQNFKNYMSEDNNIYVYGSVQRGDYFHGLSDIDISIFCENEYSAMNKMMHFLHKEKADFVKVAWILNEHTIYGYKVSYTVPQEKVNIEFAIFNKKFEPIVLPHQKKMTLELPVILFVLLYILKIFYYIIPVLPEKTFRLFKRKLFSLLSAKEPSYLVMREKNIRKPSQKPNKNTK